MDELDLLRPLRRDVADRPAAVVDAALDRSRARVMAGIADGARTAPPGRRRPAIPLRGRPLRGRPLLVVASAAAVVALGLTAAVTLTPGGTGTAEAAEVLDRAADATVDAAPTALAAGQFLRVEVREQALGYVQGDDDSIVGAYVSPTVTTTWVPADQAGTWVRESYSLPATTIYGDERVRRAAARDFAIDGHRGSSGSITHAEHGAFGNGELGGTPPGLITTDDIPTLPRDPQALLTALEHGGGYAGDSGSTKAMETVTDLLRTGLVPADLQSAMYRALALLPGLQVTHDRTVLDGRAGTAISLGNDGHDVQEIVVDDRTGTYIGERMTQTDAQGAVPAGTVADSTSVRISVVDSAP